MGAGEQMPTLSLSLVFSFVFSFATFSLGPLLLLCFAVTFGSAGSSEVGLVSSDMVLDVAVVQFWRWR
jgi:hypothetical protein